MSKDMDNYYYNIHRESSLSSSWRVCHTLEDVHQFFLDHEENLSGVTITVEQQYGWDEKERKELARLKKKYEPEEQL